MGGDIYLRHEIDRNPAASSDAGTIKAHATMVMWREDMDDSVQTSSFTWLAEEIMEDGGLASKLQDVCELFMELGFPQDEESLLVMIEAVNYNIIQLTSSGDYSRDCALSLWFTFRVCLPDPPFVHEIEEDEDDETTNNNILLIRAASKLAVKSLTRKIYNKDGSLVIDNCTICLEEFKDGAILVALPCGHEFDDECIADWFATHHICPLCRFELPREYEET